MINRTIVKTEITDYHLLNSTPSVRQYDILSNKWGVFLCQKEYDNRTVCYDALFDKSFSVTIET